ncbi:hypothetical protein [Aeromonas salmonicida]|uniref:hypothetical protein n=1 Tax=Aeromonas salmonicida TaxID=645 RepID=UPI000AD6F7F3|nr:hypothetical protein [Aeromonas salmonicida]
MAAKSDEVKMVARPHWGAGYQRFGKAALLESPFGFLLLHVWLPKPRLKVCLHQSKSTID